MSGDNLGQLIYLGLLLAALAGWIFVEYHRRLGQALRIGLAWGMIFVGLMAGYGLWSDVKSNSPLRQTVGEAGELIVPRSRDGHYYLTLTINGAEVRFVADTGATNMVLSPADAAAVGIDVGALNFMHRAETANGTVEIARTRLDSVVLGPFADRDVTAWVNGAAMEGSLLGMDYLGMFEISIAGDRMVLRR